MKKNKVLAVALSAGLVFSGAYLANSNINVAYASESQPTIKELKAQITQLKNEKNEIDRKKAQSKNAINWREDNRKVSELPEEKLKQYEIWDQKDRKVIEECDAQMLELDKKIVAIQEQIKALENSPTPGEGNPGNGSTEADKAKALEDYKKEYSEKIDALSDLTEDEKAAAKEEIANATSQAEVNKAYNKAYSRNQDAEYEREKKEREENFAKDKENAKTEIDDYGDKLTKEEKKSLKEQIDKAPTKGAIAGILEEAKKASEKEPEPENKKLEEAKEKAIKELKEAGITSDIYFNQINRAKTVEGVNALRDQIIEAHKKSQVDPGKKVTIDEYLTEVGMETEEVARKQAEDDLKSKGLEDLYDIEVVPAEEDGVETGRWVYRFVPKEEVVEEGIPLTPLTPAKEIEKPCKPCPDFDFPIIPGPIEDDTVVVPGPVVPTPEEKPEVKPSEDIDKLIKDIEQGTKDIEDTLIENEKNQKEEEKKPQDKKPEDDKKPGENKKPGKEVVVPKAAPKTNNPKTGVAGMSAVAGTLAISMAGIVATRKKNN